MAEAMDGQGSSQGGSNGRRGLQILWFLIHLAAVYAIAKFFAPWLAAWTRGTLLPLLRHPTSSGGFEFFFSHILAFTLIPAFGSGFVNARFKHKAAQFVWIVPTVILTYKFATFPAPSVFQSQFSAAFHQYFGSGLVIPGSRNWSEFWSIAGSNPDMIRDMLRGVAQIQFTAPFYAGVAYSVAASISLRTEPWRFGRISRGEA